MNAFTRLATGAAGLAAFGLSDADLTLTGADSAIWDHETAAWTDSTGGGGEPSVTATT